MKRKNLLIIMVFLLTIIMSINVFACGSQKIIVGEEHYYLNFNMNYQLKPNEEIRLYEKNNFDRKVYNIYNNKEEYQKSVKILYKIYLIKYKEKSIANNLFYENFSTSIHKKNNLNEYTILEYPVNIYSEKEYMLIEPFLINNKDETNINLLGVNFNTKKNKLFNIIE